MTRMQTNEHHVVIRLSALGDVVLATGVLRYWHETCGLSFSVVTRAAFAPVFERHPAVREVVALEPPMLRGAAMVGTWRELAHRYAGNGLIDLHGTVRTRLLGLLWKGAVRRYPKYSLERRLFLRSRGRLFRKTLRATNVPQRYALALERQAPAKNLLAPRLYLSEAECEAGRELAAEARGASSALIALHPYAAHPGKTWSAGQWRDLIQALELSGTSWIVIGAGSPIPGIDPGRDFTNRCTLRESAALLAASDALVTGDSGPMHMAVAVETPVVALFGPTTPEWGFYPAGGQDVILERQLSCRPCSLHGSSRCPHDFACMETISVQEVIHALDAMRCL